MQTLLKLAPYLREIGRGKEGARDLGRDAARELMAAVLEGRVEPVALGAFAIAMRIKGESADELAGFLDAVEAGLPRLQPDEAASPAAPGVLVCLPSYNGARRLPNLTPLLAGVLARRGLAVCVHGVRQFAGRTPSADVFAALGWAGVAGLPQVAAAWARREPAFVPLDVLHPGLARLLALRDVLGLRNSGHTLAKLLAPGPEGRTLRVVNHTHPEYADSLSSLLELRKADALLLRGTEGEPVADLRRRPPMLAWLGGQRDESLSLPAQEGVLPPPAVGEPAPQALGTDAAATARYIDAVLARRAALPPPIAQQADLIEALARRMAARPLPAAPLPAAAA